MFNKKITSTSTITLYGILLMLPYSLATGSLILAPILFVLFSGIVILFIKCLFSPIGAFMKYDLAFPAITATHVLSKKSKTIEINDNTYFYRYRSLMGMLVISEEEISTRKEAKKLFRKKQIIITPAWGDSELMKRKDKAPLLKNSPR